VPLSAAGKASPPESLSVGISLDAVRLAGVPLQTEVRSTWFERASGFSGLPLRHRPMVIRVEVAMDKQSSNPANQRPIYKSSVVHNDIDPQGPRRLGHSAPHF
jgi:hypothetical protein